MNHEWLDLILISHTCIVWPNIILVSLMSSQWFDKVSDLVQCRHGHVLSGQSDIFSCGLLHVTSVNLQRSLAYWVCVVYPLSFWRFMSWNLTGKWISFWCFQIFIVFLHWILLYPWLSPMQLCTEISLVLSLHQFFHYSTSYDNHTSRSTKLKGGILVSPCPSVCPSVRLSVCGQNPVRSVSSIIFARSI